MSNMTREEQRDKAAEEYTKRWYKEGLGIEAEDYPTDAKITIADFTKGAEWADNHPNWHKASEELPQRGGHYLCVANNHMTDLVWKGSCWFNPTAFKDVETHKVEYWMERPELPKEN